MALSSAKSDWDPLDEFLLAGYQSTVRQDGCGGCRKRLRSVQWISDGGGKARLQEGEQDDG